MIVALLLACAGREGCEDHQVFDHDAQACVDYVAGEPVVADVWRPAPGTTWQWQLSGRIDTTRDVEMIDVDLVDVSDAVFAELSDRVRVCYLSAGSLEEGRDDADQVSDEAVGRRLKGWPDERWLDVTHPDVRALVRSRLDLAVARGCDGVDPDNVDGYANGTGFPLTPAEQLQFNRFVADEAHLRGLSVGLKNDVEQLAELRAWFDWALNEECLAFDECGRYRPWLDAGRAVFHVEYVDDAADAKEVARDVCARRPAGFSTLVKTWDLGPEFTPCLD